MAERPLVVPCATHVDRSAARYVAAPSVVTARVVGGVL